MSTINTKANLDIYRSDVRTPNVRIVDDSAIFVGDVDKKVTNYGPYHAQNQRLGMLVEVQRQAYNVAHPDIP